MYPKFFILFVVFVPQSDFCDGSKTESTIDFRNDISVMNSADINRTRAVGVLSDIWKDEQSKTTFIEESRKKKNKDEQGFMEKMLPMMVTPFMISSSMIPMMLISIFFMLLKSAFIGKIGVILMLLNVFRDRSSNQGGVTNHDINARDDDTKGAMSYYGYYGDEEYGAYFNKRRKR